MRRTREKPSQKPQCETEPGAPGNVEDLKKFKDLLKDLAGRVEHAEVGAQT
jgi:hypothetical protein